MMEMLDIHAAPTTAFVEKAPNLIFVPFLDTNTRGHDRGQIERRYTFAAVKC
jgi:hypothetical protein